MQPYSIGFLGLTIAKQLKIPAANMINSYGNIVSPSSTSIGIAAIERGVNPDMTKWSDCSNSKGQFGWPLCGYGLMQMRASTTRSTCAAKAELARFIKWMKTSQAAASVATSELVGISLLSDISLSNLKPYTLSCSGQTVGDSNTNFAILGGSTQALQTLFSFFVSAYASVDTIFSYQFSPQDEHDAISQVLNSEISAAVVSTARMVCSSQSILANLSHHSTAYDLHRY
jgi:hypothetical protein